MAGSFSMSQEAETTWKIPELNVMAHVAAPFHVTSKKNHYNAILYTSGTRNSAIFPT